jgi:hypothetical protein
MKSSAKLVLLFVAVGLLLALPSAPGGSPLAFPGVDASELAKSNVRLKTPGSVAPHVSKEEAVNAALLPGATLRDATLAIVESSWGDGKPRLCWVVSQVPEGGIHWPSSGPPGSDASKINQPTYYLTMIDAETGAEVLGVIG